MNEQECIDALIGSSQKFLKCSMTGTEFVRVVNDLVSRDAVAECADAVVELVDDFQDEIALYVRDKETMKDAPGVYIGEDELRKKTERFLKELERLNPS